MRLADDVPAEVKRARLNELLAFQEPIGHERNQAWLDREVEVLVDTIVPPAAHDYDEPSAAPASGSAAIRVDGVHLSGRTRQNKVVHLTGPADWLGRFIDVQIEHAGPYALRGSPRLA
jgi:tRNA-2-methylthio-N6-dimethylallyladenosine synthase